MRFRNILLGAFYYYLLLATVALIFLFISSFQTLYDGNGNMPLHSIVNSVIAFIGVFTLHHTIGLYMVIYLKRREDRMSDKRFAAWAIAFAVFFIIPSFLFLGSILENSSSFR